jgi:hypothetical protein
MANLLSRERIRKLVRAADKLIHNRAPRCKKGHRMGMNGRSGFLHIDRSPAAFKRRQKKYAKTLKMKVGALPKPLPPSIHFACRKCDERQERALHPKEIAALAVIDAAEDARSKVMHRLYQTFTKRYLKLTVADNEWKWQGWELMKRIERAANGPLRGIKLLRCDDNYHASSMLAVIPHEVRIGTRLDEYWGTTIVYVSQCSGEPPVRLFLYGSHAKPLHTLLGQIVRAHEKHEDRY